MAIIALNRAETFSTLVDSSTPINLITAFNLDENAAMKFTHHFTLADFNESDQEVWRKFFALLQIKESDIANLGSATFESYALRWYNSPTLAKEDGKLFLFIGSDNGDQKALRLPLVIDAEKRLIKLVNGKRELIVYFGKGDYPDPENPDNRISFPTLNIIASKSEKDKHPDMFVCRVNIRQKPNDPKDVKDGMTYYDHEAFEQATVEYDPETILQFVQELSSYTLSAPLSTLYSKLFVDKQFPTAGVCLPVYEVKAIDSEFGRSYVATVDFKNAWICGSAYQALPEFTSYYGSKKKGTQVEVPSSKIQSVMIGGSHNAGKQIATFIQQGHSPSKTNPWILWVSGPNTNKKGTVNSDFVPNHQLFRMLPPIPTIKASAPPALIALPPAK